MRTILDLAVRACLSMAVLLSCAPAWKHAHAGGQQPHIHAHGHAHHDHGLGQFVHVHLTVFGFDFTLPAETDEGDDDGGCPVCLSAEYASVDSKPAPSGFVPLDGTLADQGHLLPAVAPFRCRTAIAAPLCDTARHERSGVQLI
jgi:hypothetical protein